MTPDSPLLIAGLQRQAATLGRVAADLRVAAAYPPIAPDDWNGAASRAYDGLEAELRSRLAAADDALTIALDATRRALVQLGGPPGG